MLVAEVFDKGGPVVWVLLAYSFLALVLVIERSLHYLLMKKVPRDFETALAKAFAENEVDSYINQLKGPDARILQCINNARHEGISDLDSVASRCGSVELLQLERGFRTLSILGHTAPLLGLLGTIIGMIKAFMVIEVSGGRVDAQALAGGIWEAMLTTGVGLAVAIPVLLMLHILEGKADRRAHHMRRSAMLLLERLPHECKTDQSEATHHRRGVIHAI